jgi:hypothetical protein
MLTLWFATGVLCRSDGEVGPSEETTASTGGGGGFAYYPRDNATVSKVYDLLFGKRRKKKIARLEKIALDILNDALPADLDPLDLSLLREAMAALDAPLKVKSADPVDQSKVMLALLEHAERLRRQEDDEEFDLIMALIAT